MKFTRFSDGLFHRRTTIGFHPQASTGSWGRGMSTSGAPQNTDSIHRIAAAHGKTDRILPADAPVRPKPKLLDQLREALRSRRDSRRTEQTYCHWVGHLIVTMLPESLRKPLQNHLQKVKTIYERELHLSPQSWTDRCSQPCRSVMRMILYRSIPGSFIPSVSNRLSWMRKLQNSIGRPRLAEKQGSGPSGRPGRACRHYLICQGWV